MGRFSSVSARVRRTPAVPIRGPTVRRRSRPYTPASGPNFSKSATDYPIFPLSALIFRPSVGVRTPFRGVFRSLQRIISGSRCTLRSTYDLGFFAACCAAGRCCTLRSTYDLGFFTACCTACPSATLRSTYGRLFTSMFSASARSAFPSPYDRLGNFFHL